MKRWQKYSLIFCGFVFFLLLASMLVVPWQIKKQGIAWIDRETDRTLAIEKVYFNPFTLTVEINGLNLSEQNSEQTFLTFSRLMLSVSSRSMIDGALIFDRTELDNPRINLEQFAKQEFNFSDFTRLGGDQPSEPTEEPNEPFHFSLNNIVLLGGSIDFTDQTSVRKTRHTVRDLNLSVPFVGNVPYLTDDYVEPSLSLVLNGTDIRAEGQLKPFHQSIETSLTLMLDGIDLAFYAYHFPIPLPLEVKSGEIDAEIDLAYRVSATEEPKLLIGGELALTDLDLRHTDGSPLFRLPTMIVDLDWAEILQQDINLFSFDLYQPEIYIRRDQAGQWNFDQYLPPAQEKTEEETDEKPSALPRITSEIIEIHEGKVHFVDEIPQAGFSEDINTINLRLEQFSTHPNQSTKFAFSLLTGRNLKVSINGDMSLNPILGKAASQINDIPLAPYYPYLAEQLTAPIEGSLDLAGIIHFDAEGNLRLENGVIDLTQLAVPFPDEDYFKLKEFVITDISADLPKQQLAIGSINLKEGNLKASRLADGSISPLGLLHSQREKTITEEPPAVNNSSETEAPPWQVQVGSIATDNLEILFTDKTRDSSPSVNLHQINFTLKNLSAPESQQSPFSLALNIAEQGAFTIDGTVAHSPLQLKATTQLKNLNLADYNGFLPENINLTLVDGKLYSTLSIWLEERPETLTGGVQGNLALNSLSMLDPLDQSEMLTWESLQLSNIDGEIEPLKVHIKEITLSDYAAKVQIAPNGRINLQSLTKEEAETGQSEEVEQPEVSADQESGPRPDIHIDTVTLQGGTVSFTDRHLRNQFSTTMYKLGGRISGLSSQQGMQADVDLRGQLENHSPLTISGNINPLQEKVSTNIKMAFADIDLSPMTPYSGTYLGYVIEKGKLHLDLEYLIKDQQINASNKIFIDQFTLGEEVESDQATSLPVSLAIALLKDKDGGINLDVPISGDLDDPEFSVGGAIFTILKNLLIKAATSPFALLGAMLGGDEDFTSITFDSGLATLSPSSVQKLEKLSQVLTDRPGLKLEISGFVDRNNDPEGYRKENLRQQLLAARQMILKKQGVPSTGEEELSITPEEYPTYLFQVYQEATFPRPRNFVGMLKKLPDSEMEKLLLTNTIVGENELQALAEQRTKAARDTLTAQNEELGPRIFLKKTDIYLLPEKEGTSSRVEFGMGAN